MSYEWKDKGTRLQTLVRTERGKKPEIVAGVAKEPESSDWLGTIYKPRYIPLGPYGTVEIARRQVRARAEREAQKEEANGR